MGSEFRMVWYVACRLSETGSWLATIALRWKRMLSHGKSSMPYRDFWNGYALVFLSSV